MKRFLTLTWLARILGGLLIVSGVVGFGIDDLVTGVRMNVIRNLLHTFAGIAGASVDTEREARWFFLITGGVFAIAAIGGYIVVLKGNWPYGYYVYQWENYVHAGIAALFLTLSMVVPATAPAKKKAGGKKKC
ncbi:hypothetical protein GX553_02275 [Candidatus Peribacteria bacterium]|nr:hypothetical protein [Candidatus Peribacteria bacterium]